MTKKPYRNELEDALDQKVREGKLVKIKRFGSTIYQEVKKYIPTTGDEILDAASLIFRVGFVSWVLVAALFDPTILITVFIGIVISIIYRHLLGRWPLDDFLDFLKN